jgi:hypothetical protein
MPRSSLLVSVFLPALSAKPVRAQCAGDLNGDGVLTILGASRASGPMR